MVVTGARDLTGMRIAAVLTDGYEESELVEPRAALEEVGAEVVVVAPRDGIAHGMNSAGKAGSVAVEMVTSKADAEDFDAMLLPGGVINADHLRVDRDAQEFARGIDEAGKPIGVICHGAWLLASAELVEGRSLTTYHTLKDDIQNAGGNWVDGEAVRDDNWISSRNVRDLPAFTEALLGLLMESKAHASVR